MLFPGTSERIEMSYRSPRSGSGTKLQTPFEKATGMQLLLLLLVMMMLLLMLVVMQRVRIQVQMVHTSCTTNSQRRGHR